ncbi:hypothetical protein ACFQ8U_05765 [Bacillus mobilis]
MKEIGTLSISFLYNKGVSMELNQYSIKRGWEMWKHDGKMD